MNSDELPDWSGPIGWAPTPHCPRCGEVCMSGTLASVEWQCPSAYCTWPYEEESDNDDDD